MSEMLMDLELVDETVDDESKQKQKKRKKKKEKVAENLPVLLKFQFQLSLVIVAIVPIIVIYLGLSSGAALLRTLLLAAGVELVVGLTLWLLSFFIARDFINTTIQERLDAAKRVDVEEDIQMGQMDLTEADQYEMNVEV
jgi:uncharacterized membrane protein